MDTNSEEYRHLCEARTVLRMPLHQRKKFLIAVEERRKKPERVRLENTMRAIWVQQQADQLAVMVSDDERRRRLDRIEQASGPTMRKDVEKAMNKTMGAT
jgi:hypothetical protein